MHPASASASKAAAAPAHAGFHPDTLRTIRCSIVLPFIGDLRSDGISRNGRAVSHRLAKNRRRRKRRSIAEPDPKAILHFRAEILH